MKKMLLTASLALTLGAPALAQTQSITVYAAIGYD